MREVTTTALDVLGLLLLAAGVIAFVWQWAGPSAMAVGGIVILGVSHWASRPSTRVGPSPSERVHW